MGRGRLITWFTGRKCGLKVVNLLLAVVMTGSVTYYADGVFDEVYTNRLAFGHVQPCTECIGLIAVLDRAYVGDLAYVTRPGHAEEGPFLVADCAAMKDFGRLQQRGLVAEVDWATAQRWGMRGPLYGVRVRIVDRRPSLPAAPWPARGGDGRAVAY